MTTSSRPAGASADRTPGWSRYFLPVHRWLYRRTGGLLGHRLGPQRTLLLTTTGRRSGQRRTQPLAYFREDGLTFVVASNWGNDRPPAWYLNVLANPQVNVQIAREVFDAMATVATAEQRSHLWPLLVARSPNFARYQQVAAREIPLVLLRPRPPGR